MEALNEALEKAIAKVKEKDLQYMQVNAKYKEIEKTWSDALEANSHARFEAREAQRELVALLTGHLELEPFE